VKPTEFSPIQVPAHLPAPHAIEEIVGSAQFRHWAWPPLESDPLFTGFWKRIRDEAFHISTPDSQYTVLFHALAFESPDVHLPAELPIEWLADTIPPVFGYTVRLAYSWITGAELASSRLFDYRQLLITFATRRPSRFTFSLPVTPDPLPFTELTPTRYIPMIVASPDADPRDFSKQVATSYGAVPFIEAIQSKVNLQLFQGRPVCKVDLAFRPPCVCIQSLMISLRLQRILSFCRNLQPIPDSYRLIGVYPSCLLIGVGTGDSQNHLLEIPYSAFWEQLTAVTAELDILFTERLGMS
jgi:hypothetical protein